ncbi:MAG: ATP-binding protein [Zhengella sp.]|uniref:ATP-binding protein n=1 Tax=Zhengella sp. TaxID=2282762 RepID=UPI001DA90BA6|nr:HAMP domain-containing protein [Notoacmeibacter sp.]MCC0027189.1 HAMP domain-containing protein [Brucellaceae bacterium]
MGRLLPDSLTWRFALLLAAALIAANVVAGVLLSTQRQRLDDAAREAREIERITSLVPALEAVSRSAWRAIERDASTRFSRIRITESPVVEATASDARSRELAQRIMEALPGRSVAVAVVDRSKWYSFRRRAGDRHETGADEPDTIAVSVALDPGAGAERAEAWLNLMSFAPRHMRGEARPGAMLTILVLSLVAVLGAGLLLVRHLTRPLAALAEAARAAGRGDRSVRVPEDGVREMRAAASAFNDMQARIAGFDAERMRTLAAVGHDLRTPITSLRIRAEMLDEAEAAPIIRTLDEMTVMAEGLIAYAKGIQDAETVQPVDLTDLLDRLCRERGAAFSGEGRLAVDGKPVALGRVFSNLIDNAIRYGGSATVFLCQRDGEAVVSVSDDGPGIPAERLESMFEPFVRGEESRSAQTGGAGLGLSIARSLVLAHGGSLRLENRAPRGLCATVTLPLRKP